MEKRVLMLATTAAMIEQFNKNNICLLNEIGIKVDVIGNFNMGNPISNERIEEFKKWVCERGGSCYNYTANRNPFDLKNNYKAYRKAIEVIKNNKYQFIHCHTPVGAVIGRLAAKKTKTKIVYTAHGFHFYKGAPFKNWICYYSIEKLLSRWTDVLILINQEDYDFACKKLNAKKIVYVPGVGVDLNKVDSHQCDRKYKRKELGVKENDYMIISVGEIIPRKNHELVIKAIAKIHDIRTNYYICGKGNTYKLEALAETLGVCNQVHFLGYRNDIIELCKTADLFVFPSLQEGLPVALMEAMACRCPVCASRIRGNTDLIDIEENLFDPNDVDGLADIIARYMNGNYMYLEHNHSMLAEFDISNVKEKMKYIYRELL